MSERVDNVGQRVKNGIRWPLLVAIIAIGLILRGPIVAVSPVAAQIGSDFGMSSAQVGLLTSIPILCFAVIAPLAAFFVGKVGANLATTLAIIGVGVGLVVRSADGLGVVFAGTVIMGLFITLGNVVVPVVIRRDVPPARVAFTTGAYTSAFNLGSMITALATAPIALLLGWRFALMIWVVFVIVAGLAWLFAVRSAPPAASVASVAEEERQASASGPWFTASVVLLAIAFGGQSFTYFGTTAWLPAILSSTAGLAPASAGASSSLFQLMGVFGALSVPLVASRIGLTKTTGIVAALWVIFALGLLVAPAAWVAWVIIGGLAQAAGITLVFTLIVELSRARAHTRKVSALVQGIGYGLGATAPTLLGLAHDGTGSWTVPLIAVLVGSLVFGGFAIPTARRAQRRVSEAVGEVETV